MMTTFCAVASILSALRTRLTILFLRSWQQFSSSIMATTLIFLSSPSRALTLMTSNKWALGKVLKYLGLPSLASCLQGRWYSAVTSSAECWLRSILNERIQPDFALLPMLPCSELSRTSEYPVREFVLQYSVAFISPVAQRHACCWC